MKPSRHAKKSRKQSPKANAANPADELPAEMRCLVGMTPAQTVLQVNQEANLNSIAGLFSGWGIDFGVEVPKWAKAASAKLKEATVFDFLDGFETGNLSAIGKMIGAFEAAKIVPSSKIEKAAAAFCNKAKTEAAQSPAIEAKQFFDGRASAEKQLEAAKGLSQRAKIYLFVAAQWQAIEELRSTGKFASTSDFHDFLLTIKDNKGRKILAGRTDSRETRKICKSLGLEFQNQWRKPKSKISATVESVKAGI